ncbi:MAG TPA: ABC transporter ATP-binding protein [Leptospiraceae bacterium]|nr:ABC transporter ATP-binding protein [Leptospiraceae bacterium]HMY67928.1 ABC transporter ATP-binding protein [Leptospiraceae bacterium]HNF15281.1 ABC transporter ATP-binding protein [Leptospiraceae bacterium]HNM01816.1 ABC transporter ATP-binding protein [Leptospiraceae bacterium]HNN03140.1 ABC transporter ATP-binding protein [Leptospiraceae bacterium]
MFLEVKNLTKTFQTPFSRKPPMKAVQGISFNIRPGEIYALLGPNGAGKSTTIKMIAGLIRPTSGEILLDGKSAVGHSVVHKYLSAILEGNRNVYWRMNPLENLHYFANLRGVPSAQIEEKAEKILEELNIDAKKKNQSQHLSRGMLQKLALGVGLITDPKLLLLDEPTLGMDVASSRKMRDMILALAKKEGKAILLTTHQLELVEELADRVGIIRNGQLVVEGTLAELKSIFQTYIYNVKLRGDWNPDEKIIKEYSITSKPRQGEYTEVSADCGSKDGIFRFLDRIRNDSLEVISFYKLEEDLEEIFLRVLKEN